MTDGSALGPADIASVKEWADTLCVIERDGGGDLNYWPVTGPTVGDSTYRPTAPRPTADRALVIRVPKRTVRMEVVPEEETEDYVVLRFRRKRPDEEA